LDSTLASSVLNGDSDVSLLSPLGGPGVLDDVVLGSGGGIGIVSDSEDTMVKLGSASSGDDSTGVPMEDSLIGLDGNGDWSFVKSSFKGCWVASWDILVSSHLDDTLSSLVFASKNAGGSSVWIFGLGLKWVGLNIFESVVHQSTLASVVCP